MKAVDEPGKGQVQLPEVLLNLVGCPRGFVLLRLVGGVPRVPLHVVEFHIVVQEAEADGFLLGLLARAGGPAVAAWL